MDLTNIECRTPRAGEWIRVNPDPDYQKEAVIIRDAGEYYLIAPNMVTKMRELAHERVQDSMLFLAANAKGEGFLWPVSLPVPEEHLAYQAMREWVCFPSLQ
jgi:hypothetical protein